ncbi:MAG TPA: MtrB/PioB family outer membrane beta-barrel protein, partial [Thermodesulfobacteriota bacterium]|nr:MtrB/PioB family outer membrane beta-barrel protein [Thermodesulfobacteriota bacterium]
DFLTARVGYQKLYRDADFESPTIPNNRRYAYAGQDRSTYRASVDIFPIENLNFSLDYRHKITDYKENFGLKKDRRDEFDASADYTIGKIAKVYVTTFKTSFIEIMVTTSFSRNSKTVW